MFVASRTFSRMLAVLAQIAVFATVFLLPELALAADSGGLEKATAAANTVQAWVWIVIPVVGLIAGGIVGLLYAFDVVRKETAYQWVMGIIFAGAIAGGIIKTVF